MLDRLISNPSNAAMNTSSLPQHLERRHALRVELPFPAVVRGVDATGERFTLQTTLDNLSACCLYLRLQRPVEPGSNLFLVVRLSTAANFDSAPIIAVRGKVLRTEPQANGWCGIALKFDQHRFLYTFGTAVN